ncbi:MAG: nitric-oxide reductase [Deltaproteobacteria bacterium]|nr:nitric-oxide reductase [Deltaproteobacteria bacterium]
MTYESQKVAIKYFVISAIFFGLQVVVGLLLILKYIWPDPLIGIIPFNTARAIHTNLLVVWMLFGFMGGTYYVVPEESKTELYSKKLADLQFWLLLIGGLVGVIGFLFGWTAGRPLLELPVELKWAVVIVALIFIFNVFMTMIRTKKWTAVQGLLLGGVVMLAVMWLFAIPFFKNLTFDYYYWWWVIHLWVEGAWELIAASLMAFILLKITGVERQIVEKWLYIEVALVLATGIIGTGHHYYWIGTPGYWLWWGGIFSALETVPIVLMVFDTLRHVKHRKIEIPDRLVLYWTIGCALFHFFGAAVMGMVHTLPQVNRWTHGTQVTASHGHLAFFGAYAMLILTVVYYALPKLKGISQYSQKRGFWVFWITVSMMLIMGLAFGVAGVIQSYMQRGLGIDFLTVQDFMKPWFFAVFIAGLGFFVGVLLYIIDVLKIATKKPE